MVKVAIASSTGSKAFVSNQELSPAQLMFKKLEAAGLRFPPEVRSVEIKLKYNDVVKITVEANVQYEDYKAIVDALPDERSALAQVLLLKPREPQRLSEIEPVEVTIR